MRRFKPKLKNKLKNILKEIIKGEKKLRKETGFGYIYEKKDFQTKESQKLVPEEMIHSRSFNA